MLEKNKYSMRNITNEKVTEYIDRKFVPINQNLWRMRLDAENKYIPIIQRDVETLLVNYLYTHKPKRILEIGTAIGYSAILMSTIAENSYIDTLERSNQMYEVAKNNIEIFDKKDKINILFGDANKNLDKLINKNIEKYDFVFIDAGKSHYREFWDKARQLINKDGIIFCDNILMRGMTVDEMYDLRDKHRTNIKKMREFLDYIISIDNIYTSILPVGDGVSISYIKG